MPEVRRRPRWWLIAGALFGCIVVASVAVPFLIPVDRYRSLLEDQIRTATSRDVKIAALRLQVWPRLHVRARDVRLMNPPGFPAGPTMEAQTVDLGVSLRALMNRRLAINGVTLSGVHVNYLVTTAGRSNFDLPARSGRLPAPSSTSGGQPLLTINPIGRVAIKKADFSVGSYDPRRRSVASSFAIAGLNAESHAVDATASDWLRRLEVTMDLKGARLTVPALRSPVEVRSGTLVLSGGGAKANFAATLDKLRATGTAQVARLDAPAVSFALAIPELDVTGLQRLVAAQGARDASESSRPRGPHRLVASGTVNVDRFAFAPLAASGLRAQLGVYTDVVRAGAYSLNAYGGTVTGAAALDLADAGALTTAIVHARKVDLAAFVRQVAPGAQQLSGALDADVGLRTTLAQDPRAALSGSGTFAIRDGSFPGLDMKSALAQLARLLQANVPTGQSRFSYFGGDVRIAQQRAHSTALRLDGESLSATGHGSAGFDGSLDFAGTGVMGQGGTASSASPSSTLPIPSAATLVGSYVPGGVAGRATRVPFTLTGKLPNPHFALAGTPQLLDRAGATPARQQAAPASPTVPGLPSFLQNLGVP